MSNAYRLIGYLLAATLVPAATAQESTSIEFGLPAQLNGRAEFTGSGEILLVARDASRTTVHAEAIDVQTVTNVTVRNSWLSVPNATYLQAPLGAESTTREFPGLDSLALNARNSGPIGIYLAARSFTVAMNGSANLEKARDTLGAFDSEHVAGREPYLDRHINPQSLYLHATGNHVSLKLVASDLQALEWHNFDVECNLRECPHGGGVSRMFLPGPAGTTVEEEERAIWKIDASSGSVSIDGNFGMMLIGASSLTYDVAGWARMPNARLGAACPSCTSDDGETVRAEGFLAFHDVRRTPEGRAAGAWDPTLTAVRVDETDLPPSSFSVEVAASGAAAVVVLTVVGKLVAVLFTRNFADPLAHPGRNKLHAYIQQHPGATFRELSRETTIPAGTARHHLNILVRGRIIMEKRHGSTLRFFENHGKFEQTWSREVLLREPELKIVYDWLQAYGPLPQMDVLDAMQREHGWSRSTTQHRLGRLQEGALVEVRPQGRLKIYGAKAAPVALRAPGLAPHLAALSAPPTPTKTTQPSS